MNNDSNSSKLHRGSVQTHKTLRNFYALLRVRNEGFCFTCDALENKSIFLDHASVRTRFKVPQNWLASLFWDSVWAVL